MFERSLHGRRILVVEDEYLLADDLCRALASAGAEVVGPVACIDDATDLISTKAPLDAAVLDVNLRGVLVFPLADTLARLGIPFAFSTGYDQSALPERFADRPRLEKPSRTADIVAALGPLMGERQL